MPLRAVCRGPHLEPASSTTGVRKVRAGWACECQEDLVAALPAHLVHFERFADCGHSVIADAPHRAFAIIRDFIAL